MANEPDVVRIKREKRGRALESVPVGMTRRRFLTFLGTGSAALAAGSAGAPVSGAGGEDTPVVESVSKAQAAQASRLFFTPIEPTGEDDLVLSQGFKYDVVRKWGDDVTGNDAYGYNNDFVAYFPIDALDGGQNSQDGFLWVNHEYPDPKWVSEYQDGEKTPKQVEQEKASVGGSIFRVRRQGNTWGFVEDDQYNRRIDATTPMDLTGPAAGSEEMEGRTRS